MRNRLLAGFLAIAAQFAGPALADGSDPAAEAQFKKSCGTCHTVDPAAAPRQGPNLFQVVDRPAGSIAGFKYSPAFVAGKDGIVWDAATLDRWIADPQSVIPGAIMPYKQADEAKRRLIIEFLKSAQ
ncbi:MAG TPA: c-type cytochrome [Dongiaceae bacterium]|nr:c-type cytochrome [Dongiaceae bacterium]